MPRDIPVIVLNWNRWEATSRCLRTCYPESERLWLIDNGSEEDRTRELERDFPGLRIFRWSENFGFAGGYNRALKVAAGEGYSHAYLLNNDATPRRGFLSEIVAAAAEFPNAAAIGSTLLYGESDFVHFDGKYHRYATQRLHVPSVAATELLAPPAHPSGAAMLVSVALMAREGYFDERFFCYWEETEWCWRMHERGHPSAVCRTSVVHHAGEASDQDNNALYYQIRNHLFVQRKMPWVEDPLARRRLLYKAAAIAEAARRAGDTALWEAVASAVRDGEREILGKRVPRPLPGWARLRFNLRVVAAHLRDKSRALRGLPPGYSDFAELP